MIVRKIKLSASGSYAMQKYFGIAESTLKFYKKMLALKVDLN